LERANLGANLWGLEATKTASIRDGRIHYTARCQSRSNCGRYARIQIECRDIIIGHPFWNRDFCEAHAKPLLAKAHGSRSWLSRVAR